MALNEYGNGTNSVVPTDMYRETKINGAGPNVCGFVHMNRLVGLSVDKVRRKLRNIIDAE